MPVFNRTLGALDYESPQAVQSIANHIRVMQEELEYRLAHLDSENISEIDLDVTKFMQKGQEVNNIIADGDRLSQFEQTVEGFRMQVSELDGRVAQLDVSVDGISSTIYDPETGYSALRQTVGEISVSVGDLEGNYTTLKTAVDGISVDIYDAENGKFALLEASVDEISSTIYDPETGYSVLQNTVNGLYGEIYNNDGKFALLKASVDDISITVGDLEDDISHTLTLDATGVYIVDQEGKTVSISGGQIAAESVESDKLRLYGDMTVYSTNSKTAPIGGQLGYAKSKQTGASGMRMASSYAELAADEEVANYGHSEVHVTNSGAAMRYIFKNIETGETTSAYASVYGDGVGGGAMNVDIFGSAYYFTGTALRPQGSALELGAGDHRWKNIYSAAAVNTTSDRNAKNSIEYDIDPRYDTLWSLLKPCTGKYNDGTSDRTHMFLISQDVEDAIEQAGLTSKDFAAFVKSPKEDEEGYVYALRYEEFIPMCIRRIQMLEAKLANS